MQKAVRDTLIAKAGIEHAKGRDEAKYLGRKPSFTRQQFVTVRSMLGQDAVGIASIAKETGLSRQTVYRIKDDPAGAEAALAAWGM
jgi:DNA invertase Pin-like site-specific DNA recombinase